MEFVHLTLPTQMVRLPSLETSNPAACGASCGWQGAGRAAVGGPQDELRTAALGTSRDRRPAGRAADSGGPRAADDRQGELRMAVVLETRCGRTTAVVLQRPSR